MLNSHTSSEYLGQTDGLHYLGLSQNTFYQCILMAAKVTATQCNNTAYTCIILIIWQKYLLEHEMWNNQLLKKVALLLGWVLFAINWAANELEVQCPRQHESKVDRWTAIRYISSFCNICASKDKWRLAHTSSSVEGLTENQKCRVRYHLQILGPLHINWMRFQLFLNE